MMKAIAFVLPLLASAILKPKKRQIKEMAWMVSTVEDQETVQVKSSYNEVKTRPQFEILNTEYEVGHSKTVEVYWQRPNVTKVKGVFFGATGCFHQAGDFFEETDPTDGWMFKGCKNNKLARCQGLPENVYAFKYARERGYMTLTINPQGPNSCWDHKKDPFRLNTALKYVLAREGLPEDIPMFATGASQGGLFLFDLQANQQTKVLPNLKCLAPQCAAPKTKEDGKSTMANAHLPTMFIWMVKDTNLTMPVLKAMSKLKNKNVRVTERTPHPWKIQELMKARGYSNATAELMNKELQKAHNGQGPRPMARNGFLNYHPGSDGWWIPAARKVLGNTDSLIKDHSKFHHLMQVAFAEHEFSAEYTDHMIDFCEDHEDAFKPLRFNREPLVQGWNSHALHLGVKFEDEELAKQAKERKWRKARGLDENGEPISEASDEVDEDSNEEPAAKPLISDKKGKKQHGKKALKAKITKNHAKTAVEESLLQKKPETLLSFDRPKKLEVSKNK